MKNIRIVFCLIAMILCFTACRNSIMETWWDKEENTVIHPAFHEVDFQANYGVPVPGVQHIAHNEKAAKVLPMSRDNFAFGGWFTDSAFSAGKEFDLAVDTVRSELVLYAKWVSTAEESTYTIYTVTFDSDGGNPEPGQQTLVQGTKVIEPPPMRKATAPGSSVWYGFGGWYTEPEFTYRWNFDDYPVEHNLELYARWEAPAPSHCLVTFEPNEGTPVPRAQDLIERTEVVEPLAMNRPGYGFGGWYTDPNFVPGSEWDFKTPVGSDNFTLFAKWVTSYYIVVFDAKGGTPAPPSQRAAHGTLLNAPPVMRKSGEGFMGWYIDETFTNEWNFAKDEVEKEGIVLYAKWGEAHYVVRFDLKLPPEVISDDIEGGHGFAVPPDQELTLGGRIFEPSYGNIFGWSFCGWYYSDKPDFNPTIPQHRNDLIPWDFDWIINLDGDDLVFINNDNQPETLELIHDIHTGDDIIMLYARWVPFVEDMVWVQKGSFMMGATGSGTSPVRNVKLSSGFYMAKNLVTQNDYHDVLTHVDLSSLVINPEPSQFKAGQFNRPVDRVSWYDAIAYCNWRSIKEGLNPVYSLGEETDPANWNARIITAPAHWDNRLDVVVMNPNANGYRLSTEAEWEYAARGGNGSPGNFTYAGSNNADDVAWFNNNSGSMTHPVGTKLPNGLGIYDMSGNVMEWCWDWFNAQFYSGRPVPDIDPRGPASGTERVRRGGSWNNAVNNVRSVVRNSFPPGNDTWVMGFRVVRGPAEMY
ncbi:MAG: SUMF1/EgtB/PvdO family nonheme iron enzyme [Treponema sp.]|nr:SUMF1/EgtB/PvdO family nonheme iron enzyme [Treponema sp.]